MLLTIGSSIKTWLSCWFLTHVGGDDFLIFVKESLWFSTFVDKFSTLGLGMISSGFVFEVNVGVCFGKASRINVCLQFLQTSTEEFGAGGASAAESTSRSEDVLELFKFALSIVGLGQVALSTCTPTVQLSCLVFVDTQRFTLGDVWVPKSLVLAQLVFLFNFLVFLTSEATASCKDSQM